MEDKVFELVTQMYSEMNTRFDKSKSEMNTRFDKIESEMNTRFDKSDKEFRNINMKIEHNIMPKLEALFDGFKQNTEQLTRIEAEVIKHEEVIIRRIK